MPEAWPSIRSTARWVLPVLVGPSTATRRAGAAPVGRSLMPPRNVGQAGERRNRQGVNDESALTRTAAQQTATESLINGASGFVPYKLLCFGRALGARRLFTRRTGSG